MEKDNVPQTWCFVKTRMNEAEYLAFHHYILVMGTTVSRWLRRVIRDAIGEGPDLLPHEWNLLKESTYQLGKVGANLNQLVRACHSDPGQRIEVDQALLQELRKQVVDLEQALEAVGERSRRRCVGHRPRQAA